VPWFLLTVKNVERASRARINATVFAELNELNEKGETFFKDLRSRNGKRNAQRAV
jgi:hypothetical protein